MCGVHLHYTLPRPPQRWECLLDHSDQYFPLSSNVSNVTLKNFFLSQLVGGQGDLLLTLYMLTWTMYLWWMFCEISVCHFDVWSFVSKMYMTVPLTSNGRKSSQSFMKVCHPRYNPEFASNKIPLFFLTWLLIDFSFIKHSFQNLEKVVHSHKPRKTGTHTNTCSYTRSCAHTHRNMDLAYLDAQI